MLITTEKVLSRSVLYPRVCLFIISDHNLLCYIVIIRFIEHDDVLSYGSENKLFYFYLFLF